MKKTSARARTIAIIGVVLSIGVLGVLFGTVSSHQFRDPQRNAENSSKNDANVSTSDEVPDGASQNSSIDGGPDSAASSDHSTVSMVQPPTSLYGLVIDAHAIVIGTVVEVADERLEGPYSIYTPSDAGQLDPTPPPDSLLVGFTYFRVQVDQIVLPDGRLREGDSFLLRIDGTASESEGSYGNLMPFPEVGSNSLFVLGANPDQESYGIRGPWGRILLDGPVVRYGDWELSPVPFAVGLSPEQFLAQLESTIREVQFEQR